MLTVMLFSLKERRRLAAAVEELEARGATQVIASFNDHDEDQHDEHDDDQYDDQHEDDQVHIRAASWRGGKEERRTLPRTLLTKMVRIRLKTEVSRSMVMVLLILVEVMIIAIKKTLVSMIC